MNGSWSAPAFKRKIPEVSDLYNSLDFGLDSVTIIEEDDGFKLVVRQYGHTLFSKSYETLTEARDGFLEHFGNLSRDEAPAIQPQWTDFFNPQDELDFFTLYFINQERMLK